MNTVFPLESTAGRRTVIELVPGPHPYLWIGEGDGTAVYGTTKDTEQLRALRDAITQALREAQRA